MADYNEMPLVEPEFVDVPLTLEESGMLCHFMMRDDDFRNLVASGRTHGTPLEARLVALYKKLSDANDKLMMAERPCG